jgi:hypothetical protein
VSVLRIESFEKCGDERPPAKTDAGAGAATSFVEVDFDAEELAFRAEIRDVVFFRESGLDFDRSFGNVFWVSHRAVVDVHKHRNPIAAEMENGALPGTV